MAIVSMSAKPHRKDREKMYRDTTNGVQQTGYVFKASTEVDFDRRWIKKYADIWAEINELTIPFN